MGEHGGGMKKVAERLAAPPAGHRVRRPVTPEGTETFDLTYVRTGPPNAPPVLVVPGGPGMASVFPYRGFRSLAVRRGMQLIMVEHRGIGLSRHDDAGRDLRAAALTVEQVVADLAAVLDHAGIEKALVYGSSYGTYVAQGFGLRHPERVAGMVLDSPMLTARDNAVVRSHLRRVLWDGGVPETARSAALLRKLVAAEVVPAEQVGAVIPPVYEFAGPAALEQLLTALQHGRGLRTWNWIADLGTREADRPLPYAMETDLVGEIAYRELAFGAPPDGHPLDPQVQFVAAATRHPAFAGEPYDLPAALPEFRWPTAVVSGDRDVRTPRPVAERIAALVPDAQLVELPGTGHSALDTHALAALHIAHAVAEGAARRLPQLAPRIAKLPRRGASRWIGPLIHARLTAELRFPF